MTYSQLKNPWITAHKIEPCCDHEIAMASAEPKVTPCFATS